MSSKITSNSTLNAVGMKMPVIGIGTWTATEAEIETTLDTALEAGYRHIDTAFAYCNEAAIGKTLKKWFDSGKLKREDLFIVTKLPPNAMNAKYVEETIRESLTSLQLSYVDLYLIHLPIGCVHGEGLFPTNPDGTLKLDMTTDHLAIWKAMEAQVDAGRTKAIGVSNFSVKQIERILKNARIPPATNQVEMHAYYQQRALQEFSKKSGVTITAFGPIGSPGLEAYFKAARGSSECIKVTGPIGDPVVTRIAKAHGKTPAQVLLRHLLQLGVAVIPKSCTPSRIQENFKLFDFELSPAEIKELNSLDKGEAGRRFAADMMNGASAHPEHN